MLGGSFDPVHQAHVELARRCLEQFQLGRILLIPTARSPLKSESPVATAEQRLHMLELVFAEVAKVHLDEREIHRAGPTPTVDTLRELREEYPEEDWVFILGEDNFQELDRWKEAAALSGMCDFIVAPRGEAGERPIRWRAANVYWLEGFASDLSSSALRESLAAGRPASGLDPEVERYIHRYGLYGTRPE